MLHTRVFNLARKFIWRWETLLDGPVVNKKLYDQLEKKNERLKGEIAKYIFIALRYQHEHQTDLNDRVTPYLMFQKLENIKLAAFILAYEQNKGLAMRLAKILRIEEVLPDCYKQPCPQKKNSHEEEPCPSGTE